jgi:hypothetical protein
LGLGVSPPLKPLLIKNARKNTANPSKVATNTKMSSIINYPQHASLWNPTLDEFIISGGYFFSTSLSSISLG